MNRRFYINVIIIDKIFIMLLSFLDNMILKYGINGTIEIYQ